MPELPEIVVLSRDMHRELAGRAFSAIEVLQPKCLNVDCEVFRSRLIGAQILDVAPHGKWIQVHTDRGWLLLNLGMGGEVLLTDRSRLPDKRRLVFDLGPEACLAVSFFWFGYAHYAAHPSQHPMVGRLGPHALGLSLHEFQAVLKGRRGAIKAFLLDQDHIAGIGNVYVQDPLFRAGLHPLRPVQSLAVPEVTALWRALQDTLQQSVDLGGAEFEVNLYGLPGKWGSAHLLVGYREGKPCPACGANVVKVRTGSTHSYICPECQPLSPEG